jgi:hypothetical protein
MTDLLAQVSAPHFCAGLCLEHDRVTVAADILKYMVGWERDRVRSYCQGKGWSVRVVRQSGVTE